MSLTEIIEKQAAIIQTQIEGLNKAITMCERMLEAGNVSFDELQIEKYVTDLETYWNDNKPVFKLDSVSVLSKQSNIEQQGFKSMLQVLKNKGYKQTSLSVQKGIISY